MKTNMMMMMMMIMTMTMMTSGSKWGGGGENTLFSVTPYNFQKGGEAEAPSPPGPPPSWSLCDSTAVEGKAFHTRKVLTKK